jgi:hypothetical protein
MPAGAEQLIAVARELITLGERALARPVFEACVERFPGFLAARLELANLLWSLGAQREALDLTLETAELAPNELVLQHNIALIAPGFGLYATAARAVEKIIARDPNVTPAYRFQLAECLDRAGEFEPALRAYEDAIKASPDDFKFHVHYGYALLRQGRWHEGWREMGWYWRPAGLAQFAGWGLTAPKPLLREGDPVDGKMILVTGWGGGGDMVMFTQLAEHLARRGARVTLHITQSSSFFRGNRWGFPVNALKDVGEFFRLIAAHDAWVPNAHLPAVLALQPDEVQSSGAYLAADEKRREHWRNLLAKGGSRRKVGLAWSGNPANLYDFHRSIPTGDLLPLLATAGIDWYIVQKNEKNAELRAFALPNVTDPSDSFVELEDTAALMSELDLVISADSLPAHLAGSLGKPVWLLASAAADWRWGVEGSTTRWYSSMRIYRQHKLGDWPEVLARVALDLARV